MLDIGAWLSLDWYVLSPPPESDRPWYTRLVWAAAYSILALLFFLASSPLIAMRSSRFEWSHYGTVYQLIGMWVFANIVGHTPVYTNHFEFDTDEPASLLMPREHSDPQTTDFLRLLKYRRLPR